MVVILVAFYLWLTALQIDGLERSVSLDVADSSQKVVLLEGSLRNSDVDHTSAEPTTFVPDCRWYREIPCTCAHVRFDQDVSGSFKHGFDRLWHLRSLQQMLTVQTVFYRAQKSLVNRGPHFWHAAGFGLFKNSLDAGYFIANAYGTYFGGHCRKLPECRLTTILSACMDWLIFAKQFALFPWEASQDRWKDTLDELLHPAATSGWIDLPWEILLEKPSWAEALLYVVDELERYALPGVVTRTPHPNSNVTEKFQHALLHMGAKSAHCFDWERWHVASRNGWASSPFEARVALNVAVGRAFDESCTFHPVRRLVLFAQAVRPFLPQLHHLPWPSSFMGATRSKGSWVWRLCNDGKPVHRRVGQAELHILAADVVEVGNSTLLEFLWMAGSDDGCVMAGANFHNIGDSYYSFAHTLPAAHSVHWHCTVHSQNEKHTWGNDKEREAKDQKHASSVSFSGFLTVTACLLPPALASAALSEDSNRDATLKSLKVTLTSFAPDSWNPEPFYLCLAPKPEKKRFISACTATLHGADRVQKILPHAIEDWINYHLLIGVEHFTLFDTDGSYEPYVKKFVESGKMQYHGRFPSSVSPTLGLLAAGLKEKQQQRAMLMEPHAIETCIWENRHVSDWIVVIHSFEEYLHSPAIVEATGSFNLGRAVRLWTDDLKRASDKDVALFEFFQEPMGAASRPKHPKSVFSAWPWKRALDIGKDGLLAAQGHVQPFSFIGDPLNILQSAVHFAQARADNQNIMVLQQDLLRVNHYVDFGSNATRCLDELGGCNVRDDGMLWAEEKVIQMRSRKRRYSKGVREDASKPSL